MMHCKQLAAALFSFHTLHYCCFQLLLLCASVKVADGANSTAPCSSSSMECANFGNISYPFWGSTACAASPSYVLSNCTSSSAEVYWDSFSPAVNGTIGPPAVAAVEPYVNEIEQVPVVETSIQLYWNKSVTELDFCAPLFSSKNLSLYNIPTSINLTRFDSSDSSALEFSTNNTYLLFNCTQHNTSSVVAQLGSQNFVTESALGCLLYKGLCPSLAKNPCIQWSVPQSTKELMLQQVLDSLACSHFMFGVGSLPINEWSTGSIKLIWRDIQCENCIRASGNCSYDTNFPAKFNQCTCSNGIALDFNTQTDCISITSSNDDCDGGTLRCNTGVKLGFAFAVITVVFGIFLVIRFKGDLAKLCGMIRERLKNACVTFTNVTVPIAINVLKTALRKLQSVSYGPNAALDSMDFDGLTERPMEYSYGTIASATKSFTTIVGEGGFSSVYKGTLTKASSDGNSEVQIAVKVLEVKSKHSKKQFLNEVITIGRIHHVNVVRLLGFCMRGEHEILVYEYVVNGSLDSWLFSERASGKDKVLDWGKRYAIALGVARGLSYLHEECRHRTVHCDIKPQNILLDENMHPKIADFGLARLMGREESKVMTFAKGTPGYMAPEFWMGGESQLSTKFDVYSYGMVLLELISGRRNFRHDATLNSSSSFPAMAFQAAMEGDLQSILDSSLTISTIDGDEAQLTQAQWDQIKTTAFVALWCIQDHPKSRPCMSDVVKYLEGGATVSESPPQPNISTFYRPASISCTPQESSSYNYENDSTVLSVGR